MALKPASEPAALETTMLRSPFIWEASVGTEAEPPGEDPEQLANARAAARERVTRRTAREPRPARTVDGDMVPPESVRHAHNGSSHVATRSTGQGAHVRALPPKYTRHDRREMFSARQPDPPRDR